MSDKILENIIHQTIQTLKKNKEYFLNKAAYTDNGYLKDSYLDVANHIVPKINLLKSILEEYDESKKS